MRNKRDLVGRLKKRLSASASSASLGKSTSSITPSVLVSNADQDVMTPTTKRKSFQAKLNDQFNHLITGIRSMSADRVRSASKTRGE
jgi:hypothetical protein